MTNDQSGFAAIPTHFSSIREAADFWRLCKEYWDVVEELEFEVNSPYFCDEPTTAETPERHQDCPNPA